MDDPLVRLERYHGPWDDGDRDANFKAAVAEWTLQDPLPTFHGLSRATGIPVGALVRYALVRWAAEGSEALLHLGPRTIERMWQAVEDAEAAGTDAARLAAYAQLRDMIAWLRAPLEQ